MFMTIMQELRLSISMLCLVRKELRISHRRGGENAEESRRVLTAEARRTQRKENR